MSYKARLVVRGDLQTTFAETSATTLAARVFRALIAIIAYFGLEMRQSDIVNAFINAMLGDLVYITYPDGFPGPPGGYIRLRRALYGLKQSPYLWQQHFTRSLLKFGLKPVSGIDCLFIKGGLIVLFFVADIIVACPPSQIHLIHEFEAALAAEYDIKRLGEPQYFLGIRIIRDCDNRSISLVQDAYIEKIATRFGLDNARETWSPLPARDLPKNTAQASLPYCNRVKISPYCSLITHCRMIRSRQTERGVVEDGQRQRQWRDASSAKWLSFCRFYG